MNKSHIRNIQRQKGMSTLVVILLLMFVATMVTLFTANSTIREQQVSANQYRADQALSAANAGLDYAVAYYSKNTGPDANADGVVDVLAVPNTVLNGENLQVFATVTYTDGDATVDRNGDGNFSNDALDRPHTVTSVGFSDDRSATRTVIVQVDSLGLLPTGGLPGFPLVARGFAASGGNFTIINRFSNATIWTGADTTAIGSAETYVKDPNYNYTSHDELVSIAGSPDPTLILHASYNKSGINSDIIENDDNLANMSPDQFFQNFMIEDKATVRAFAEANGQRFDSSKNWNDLTVAKGIKGLVWIDVPVGGTWSPSGSMDTIGSEAFPTTLIIDGSFKTTGGGAPAIRIVGLLYVTGDWTSSGNFAVQGGAMVEGDVGSTGTPTIVYDEALYGGALGNPGGIAAAIRTGTWKDW